MACLIRWVHEFLKLDGVTALTDLLETLEKRTMKKVADFELMDQVRSPYDLHTISLRSPSNDAVCRGPLIRTHSHSFALIGTHSHSFTLIAILISTPSRISGALLPALTLMTSDDL